MKRFLLIGLVLANSAFAAEETIVTKRLNAQNRLVPLTKVTVGPDDQYRAAVVPTGESLVYTKKADLVPHLVRMSTKTGEETDVLPRDADSQEAAVSSTGRLAFTYYRFNARGDVCHRMLSARADSEVTCLKAEPGERSEPFWKSAAELGYRLRDMRTFTSRVVVENIETGAKETLAEGDLWSPAMAPNGQYLFFNQLFHLKDADERVLSVKDLRSGKTSSLRLQIPGLSGFPAVDDGEKFLYFSHYLNDTNHDNVIDGSDNSVVFRIPIDRIATGGAIFPEQLTSAESNCSLPRPFKDELYVTCGFEGSLDIYRLPVTGVVPVAWNEARLWNAHQTARTYQERILLLDTLRYRFPATATAEMQLRILGDHLLADDVTAALYYVNSFRDGATGERKTFYRLLGLYLEAQELKKAQPSDEIGPSFYREIVALDGEIAKVPGNARFRLILRGLLRTFLNQPAQAAEFLSQVRFDGAATPLERYFYFELAAWTLPRSGKPDALTAVYRAMITAPELSHESRIYYAFRYLQSLQTARVRDRSARIVKMRQGLTGPVAPLLDAELATLKIIAAPDDRAKHAEYRALDALMSASRSDYFLRKALYVRSILNLAEAADFLFLKLIATNWLRYTEKDDTEFAQAREAFVQASLDQAYDNFGQGKFPLAGSYFYGSLSLTDDLESHYGYIKSEVAHGARETLDERYEMLQQREFIADNMKFVRALLRLIDKKDVSAAIDELRSMGQDRDSPVRYLLLGYCHLEKLLSTANGYEFDLAVYEDAHRSLMLAYDLGRDNARIASAALMNLGILHQRVQNHRLATKFLEKRRAFAFVTPEEKTRFSWIYAKSLFYAYQPERAAEEIGLALGKSATLPDDYRTPFEERHAFYLQSAGRFSQAVEAYRKLLASGALKDDRNLAKAYLGYGFSLFKLKRGAEARKALETSISFADKLKPEKKGGERLVDFRPERLTLTAYGLLARLGGDAAVPALENRGRLLAGADAVYDDVSSRLVQNKLQLAFRLLRTDRAAAAAELRAALVMAERLGDSGQYLSQAVYQTALDYLLLASVEPQLFRGESPERIRKVVDRAIAAYDGQKPASPELMKQKEKLRRWMAAYPN